MVIPDPEALPDFAAKLGAKGSYEELCKNTVSIALTKEQVLQLRRKDCIGSNATWMLNSMQLAYLASVIKCGGIRLLIEKHSYNDVYMQMWYKHLT